MWFDLLSYPGWLAAALAMGLVVGWRTYSDAPRRSWFGGWIIWGALVFVVGVIVAVLKLLPGRYGLWLEIALLMTATYIIGCFLGGALKTLLGAHEPRSAARAAAERLAADAAAKAAAGRKATAAKAQTNGLAAAAFAKAETEQKAAAVSKAEANRQARSPRRGGLRLLPLPRRRRIALQRKWLQKRSLEEKLLRPPKPRRIIRLQKLPRRPRLSDKLPPRPRRIIWLQRLPRRSNSGDRLILIAGPAKARSRASSTRYRLRRPMDGRTISG